ncbi:sodium/proline symporter [Candidatus Neomarinimicrobiota bacterium]
MSITGIVFIIYLVVLLSVGVFTYRFNKTQEDFLLAGRKLGPWVVAFSERASGESAWLLVALPGAAIAVGLGEVWAAIGIICGIILAWFIIANRLRTETEKYNALTIPQYLHRRYNDNSNIIRLFAAFIITFFFAFYVSAQFHASGKILNTIFGLNEITGICIGAIIIVLYTLMGGFFAVAWTDLFQGIIMIGTLVILPIVGFFELHELGISLSDSVIAAGGNRASLTMGKTGWAAASVVIGGLSWGLGYFGQPHLVIRYMSIRSSTDIKKSRLIASAWAIPGISGAFMIGLVALALYGADFFPDVEQAMPYLATQLLPAWVAGIVISGAVAAMMSTADSQLLVSTSAITVDFYQHIFKKNKSQKSMVRFSRIITVILGIFAFTIAIISELTGKTIFGVVSYAWSGLGSSFGPALILTLWWKKTSRIGVITGMLCGAFITIIWANINVLQLLVTERLVSFVVAFIAVIILSLLKPDKTNEPINTRNIKTN